jgi:ribosomal protein S18 acetylase RimI-like enzyme
MREVTRSPILRPATRADAALALSWTPGAEELRRWSGPSTRHPATPDSLWEDINNSDATTFAWHSAAQGTIGLGQVRLREPGYGHLARIIVSPQLRGQGLGRALCLALMHEAVRLNAEVRTFSLYVFPDNTNAIGLYRSLGYVERGLHPQFNCVRMEAPRSVLPAHPPTPAR